MKPSNTSSWKWLLGTVVFTAVALNLYYGARLLKKRTSPSPSASQSILSSLKKPVPDFTLTSQDGTPFSRDKLLGKNWVASFIFTRCTGPCPVITANLARLQQSFEHSPVSDQIAFVSFSIDPEHDSPGILRQYARRFNVNLHQWTFLTGPKQIIKDLSMKGFYSAILKTTPETAGDAGPFVHGTRVYVVNTDGTIVASYDGTTPEGINQTRKKLLELTSPE